MNTPNQKAKELFLDALNLPDDARTAFLAQECGSDKDIRVQVVELLREHERAAGFMDRIWSGRLGEVYEVRQSETVRRTVALKVIKLEMATREITSVFVAGRQARAPSNGSVSIENRLA